MSSRSSSSSDLTTRRRLTLAFWGLAVIAVVFLVAEHRMHLAPFYPYLPFAIVLLCPLLHLFGHGGHRMHGGNDSGDASSREHRH